MLAQLLFRELGKDQLQGSRSEFAIVVTSCVTNKTSSFQRGLRRLSAGFN